MRLRENNISKLQKEIFDVLILGGGINGAVSASALSTRGLSTALIEKKDFASFTSQESSNLVWGGIKYLQSFELGLVYKLCKSRNYLIRSYPSNVKEIRFLASIGKGFPYPVFFIYLASLAYWFIGLFFTKRPRRISRKKLSQIEPSIHQGVSKGGFEYSDAYLIDNDARFVFKFIRSALDHSAIATNYVESLDSSYDGTLWTTKVRNQENGEEFSVRSKVLINACGPYTDSQNKISKQETKHRHLFSKGVHLIVPQITKNRRVITFFADDGRPFFIIPMGNRSCVGTTDTRTTELPPRVLDEDREFIIQNINRHICPTTPLKKEDIIAERCGVRPLVIDFAKHQEKNGKIEGEWTDLSRKHVIETDQKKNHISIYGGKLTDCLNIGEEVCRGIRRLGFQLPYKKMKWYGEASKSDKDEYFHQAALMNLDQMTEEDASQPLSRRLWRRYGRRAIYMLEEIRRDPAMGSVLIQGTEYLRVEIHHASRNEMIVKLEDFLRRRSRIALLKRSEEIRLSQGLQEACNILFGNKASQKIEEYFQPTHKKQI